MIPVGTPGFRANCVSCVCGAAAVLLFYLFCQRWYSWRGLRHSSALALVPAGLMAFAPLFWQYHTQAEVFSLNNLLIAAQLLLLQRLAAALYAREGAAADADDARLAGIARPALAGAFAVGLGFANQHTIVFQSLPIVAFALGAPAMHGRGPPLHRPETLARLAAAGLAGLSPYLYFMSPPPPPRARPARPPRPRAPAPPDPRAPRAAPPRPRAAATGPADRAAPRAATLRTTRRLGRGETSAPSKASSRHPPRPRPPAPAPAPRPPCRAPLPARLTAAGPPVCAQHVLRREYGTFQLYSGADKVRPNPPLPARRLPPPSPRAMVRRTFAAPVLEREGTDAGECGWAG